MDQTPVSRLEVEHRSPRSVALSGEIDSHTAPLLDEALAAEDPGEDLSVELSAVGFVDSSGLRVLVTHHQRFDEAGSRLELTAPSDAVVRLLEMTGLTETMHITGAAAGEAG